MANLSEMSAEQLRALADKKERDAQPDIIDFQRAGGSFDSRPFEGTKHVDVYGLDVSVYLPRLNSWTFAKRANEVTDGDFEGVENLLEYILGASQKEKVMERLSEVNRDRNAEWCKENGEDPDTFYEPSITDMMDLYRDIFGAGGTLKN